MTEINNFEIVWLYNPYGPILTAYCGACREEDPRAVGQSLYQCKKCFNTGAVKSHPELSHNPPKADSEEIRRNTLRYIEDKSYDNT